MVTRTPAATVLIILASTWPASSAERTAPATQLAVEGAITVTQSDLDGLLGDRLIRIRTEEYQIRRQALGEYLARTLLEREAAARSMSAEQLVRAEVDAKVQAVTEEEVRAVYDSARDQFSGQAEGEAKRRIADAMLAQRLAQRRKGYSRELEAKAGLRVLLEVPRVKIVTDQDDLTAGPREAEVTIVEYSDFQCPFCARAAQTLKQILEKHKGRVRLIFRDYPLPFHANAAKAAEAARCAQEQGKFWEMHDRLFANQKALQLLDLKKYAREVDLDTASFDQCLDSGRTQDAVGKSHSEAERLGVGSTPTMFVNGRFVPGAMPLEPLDDIVREELDRPHAQEH